MISVAQARDLIWSHTSLLAPVNVSIEQLGDFTLAEGLVADRPLPPIDRVTMDGIAISFDAYTRGHREFQIQGCQRAGEPALELESPQGCIEVMTGAKLPSGCTAVLRYEDLIVQGGVATIVDGTHVEEFLFVHRKGSDAVAGKTLVAPGSPMLSAEWSVAASIGKSVISIQPKPRIAIVTTGDELVPVNGTPKDYEIRGSNKYALMSSLRLNGFDARSVIHLRDNPQHMTSELAQQLDSHDVIITTGGVSKGKFDYLPAVLADLNVRKIFHQVAQRPGKPFWFGVGERGQLVFGLPGNPVSVMVNFHAHVLPALRKMAGKEPQEFFGRLSEPVRFVPLMTLFQPVKIKVGRDASIVAYPQQHNGSGDFAGLLGTDGIMELPAGRSDFNAHEVFPIYRWSPWT